jgi:predicted AlkP superfamily pyrophosphatase or phosphodiesterase
VSAPSRLLLLDVVGLTPSLVRNGAPNLARLAADGTMVPLECPFPALTCSSQASLLTGRLPREHGIVGNGWYFRDLQEPWLWRQSHALLEAEDLHGRVLREVPGATVARLFLWYAMGAPATWCVTPRPQYKADGRKVPDVWTSPPGLRSELQQALGPFPLFEFWGPKAGLGSSRWIVDAAAEVWTRHRPTLLSVYVPHLDYDFQRHGPDDSRSRAALRDVDALVAPLVEGARRDGASVVVVSEYGIERVDRAVHPNRALREAGLLVVRDEGGGELLDPVSSRAFAVSDHQVAHVYVKDPALVPEVRRLLAGLDGVAEVLEGGGKRAAGLDHPRSGELVLVASAGAWFTYYYWLEDARAPDFARCVEIHRKPGYDPAELAFDPRLPAPKLAAAWKLAKRMLGFRSVFDVIGLDPSVVHGSHGRRTTDPDLGPVLIAAPASRRPTLPSPFSIRAFPDLVLSLVAGVTPAARASGRS